MKYADLTRHTDHTATGATGRRCADGGPAAEISPDLSFDPGLVVLEMLLRIQNIETDLDRLQARFEGSPVDVAAMFRCARGLGLDARSITIDWERLASSPLPGIAKLRNGEFLLLGKATDDHAVVLTPQAARPSILTRRELEEMWDGQLVIIRERHSRVAEFQRFLFGWWQRTISRASVLVDRDSRTALQCVAKNTARHGANVAGAVVIDFTHRAHALGRTVARQVDDARRRADERAFLPAALEIVETPPSPLGRATAISIATVFTVALAWACIGKVDIIAIAPGKIVPSGRNKIVQPFETSVVRAIHVHDGQHVKAGDPLIELDATISAADLGSLKANLKAAQLDVARLRAVLAAGTDPDAAFRPPADASPASVEMQKRHLFSQIAEHNAKIAAIDRQVAQKEAERATIKASIDKLKATINPLQQRVDIREQLFQKELGSKLTYLTELQDLVGQRQEVTVQESRYSETDAAIAALKETRRMTFAEHERGVLDELAKAELKAVGLTQEMVKAQQRASLQTLTAPVDGIVQQLAVHTIGGVVTPAQTLMLVVPAESRLEVEAMISNQDIGFVEAGQTAAIKVDTFSFTRYGVLQGIILDVSQDAITRDKPPERSSAAAPGAAATSSEPKGQELIYSARVSIDRSYMEIDNKRMKLSPGMAVTTEIKTGSRSIISYLMSPLVRYKHDSLRER